MESERYQQELFEFKQPKKQRSRLADLFRRTDFAVTLTVEKLIIVSIILVMLFVVFFALGVEKGKGLAASKGVKTGPQPVARAYVQPVIPARRVRETANINYTRGPAVIPAPPRVDAPAKPNSSKPYTVVAAAFSKQEFASKEISMLKKKGLEGFVYYSDPYYLVCVGEFSSKSSAQAVLNKVKKVHRDAYVRLR